MPKPTLREIFDQIHEPCLRSKTLVAVRFALQIARQKGNKHVVAQVEQELETLQTSAKEDLILYWLTRAESLRKKDASLYPRFCDSWEIQSKACQAEQAEQRN